MWYVLEDTIPANTTRANKRTTKIKVFGGILHTIYVLIPPGSTGFSHFQLRKASYYILPRNEDKSLYGDHLNVPYREWLPLKSAENTLSLDTWNLDPQHAHKIRLMIGIEKREVMEMEENIIKDLRLFLKLFRRRT